MTLEESTDTEDQVVEIEGIKFVLTSHVLNNLKDGTIDYVEKWLRKGFSITGPRISLC